MLNIFSKIAEQKIREAQERGDFKDLIGKGEPLDLADYSRVPEEMRMAYTILKNAGYSPPEVTLKKEIIQIEDMLASIMDEQEKYRQIKKLNFLVTKLNLLRNSNINFEEEQRYFPKVVSKISIAPRKDKNSEKE